MLSIRHLEIFRTVSETGSFTKAAGKLYITQSAVSRSIRELEEQAGILLFDRLPKQVRLTPGGKRLLEEAAPILSQCESLEKRLPHLEAQAPLRIVSCITIASYWLPPVLKKFAREWEDITVRVEVVPAADALRILQAGEADLALVEGALPKGRFLAVSFASYPLIAVCAPGYLPFGSRLSIGEFSSEKLLLREKGSAIRDVIDSSLILSGHTVRPLWTSVNSSALIQAAKAGLGLTVLPEILVRNDIIRGELIPVGITDMSLRNDMYTVCHQDKYLSGAVRALLTMFTPEGGCEAIP